jgi:hypothetical protein
MHFLSSGKTNVLLLWLSTVTITPTVAFLPSHQQSVVPKASVSTFSSDRSQSWSTLNMAFDSTERSNIYDGPMALTKERDACGVGFVANPKEGECVELPFVGGSNQIETNQPWFLFPGIYLFTPTTNYLI